MDGLENIENVIKKEKDLSGILTKLTQVIQDNPPGSVHAVEVSELIQKALNALRYKSAFEFEDVLEELGNFLKQVVKFCISGVPLDLESCSISLANLLAPPKRCAFLTIALENSSEEEEEEDELEEDKHHSKQKSIQVFLWKLFLQQKGPDVLSARLNTPGCPVSCSFYFGQIAAKLYPLIYRHRLEFDEPKCADDLAEAFFNCISALSDNDLKQLDPHSVLSVFTALSKSRSHRKLTPTLEFMRVEIAIKFLQHSSMKFRVEGISLISKLCEYALVDQHEYAWDDDNEVNTDELAHTLCRNNIVQIIFGSALHAEIISRSTPILQFLANQKDALATDQVIFIWESSLSKHETITREILGVLQKSIKYFSYEPLVVLFQKIQCVPISNWNTTLMKLSYAVTDRGLQIQDKSKSQKCPFGLDIWWEIMKDGSRAPPEVFHECCSTLCAISKRDGAEFYLYQLFEQCVKCLRSEECVVQSFDLLAEMLTHVKSRNIENSRQWAKWLHANNIMKVFFTNLQSYTAYAKSKTLELPPGVQPENYVFKGMFPHRKTIDAMLKFINIFVPISGFSMTVQDVDTIWNALVENAICSSSCNQFFTWLEQIRGGSGQGELFSINLTEYIFKKLATIDLATLSMEGFSMFEFYFRYVNWANGKFEQFSDDKNPQQRQVQQQTQQRNVNYYFRVLSYDLIGYDLLWEIALRSRDNQVGLYARNFLLRLSRCASGRLKSSVSKYREQFMERCLLVLKRCSNEYNYRKFPEIFPKPEKLKKTDSNFLANAELPLPSDISNSDVELILERTVTLFTAFVDYFDDGLQERHGVASRGASIRLIVKFAFTQPSTETIITVNENDTVGMLRQKIALEAKTLPKKLKLTCPSSMVRLLDDNKSIKTFKVTEGSVITVHQSSNAFDNVADDYAFSAQEHLTRFPKNILSQEKYFSQILDLVRNLPEKFAIKLWEILEKLPTNTDMKKILCDLTDKQAIELLDPSNIYKLLYSLQIIEALMYGNSHVDNSQSQLQSSQNISQMQIVSTNPVPGVPGNQLATNVTTHAVEWIEKFTKVGGFSHLFTVLFQFKLPQQNQQQNPESQHHGSKQMACLSLLLKVCTEFISLNNQANKLNLIATVTGDRPLTEILQHLVSATWNVANIAISTILSRDQDQSSATTLRECESIVQRVMAMLGVLLASDYEKISTLCNFKNFSEWVEKLLLEFPTPHGRNETVKVLQQMCTSSLGNSTIEKHPRNIILALLFSILPKFSGNPELTYRLNCKEYFMLTKLIVHSGVKLPLNTNVEEILLQLIHMIHNHPIYEKIGGNQEDLIISGFFDLTTELLRYAPHLREIVGSQLISEVSRCLFEVPKAPNLEEQSESQQEKPKQQMPPPPMCKFPSTREKAFNLLSQIVSDCPQNLHQLSSNILKIHEQAEFQNQWEYLPEREEISATGFVGLRNLGATCYMNSLFQQLFMRPQLRYSILAARENSQTSTTTAETKPSDSVLFQLQSIFAHLQESMKREYNTIGFCKAYKVNGNPVKVNEQMDVDEFVRMLFDKLEGLLKNSPHEKVIDNFFGGKIVNQVIPKECSHRSEREEHFLILPVDVKNKRKLTECLDFFIQGDLLEGDNKFLCESCNTHVTALKRCCLGDLPNILIIHLKRFDFNLEFMYRSKVNQFCEFPEFLNLENYTKEGLDRRENTPVDISSRSSTTSSSTTSNPLEFYEYKLTGILVHAGTSETGHYYSYIRDPISKQWFEFNDDSVFPFNPQDIAEQCYGGFNASYDANGATTTRSQKNAQKDYSAYLLFYERLYPTKPPVENPIPPEKASQVVSKELFDTVWKENKQLFLDKNLFDKQYLNFMKILLLRYSSKKIQKIPRIPADQIPRLMDQRSQHDDLFCLIRHATLYFVQVLAHSADKSYLTTFTAQLASLYNVHTPACQWFANYVYTKLIFLENTLLQCPIASVRDAYVTIIIHIAKRLEEEERDFYLKEAEEDEAAIVQEEDEPVKVQDEEDAIMQDCLTCIEPKSTSPLTSEDTSDGLFLINQPKTRPSSSFTLLFMKLVSFIPKTQKMDHAHQNLRQFYRLLQELCSISGSSRRLCIFRGYLSYFCHVVLGDNSPMFQGKKRFSDKSGRSFSDASNPLLGGIVSLARTFTLDTDNNLSEKLKEMESSQSSSQQTGITAPVPMKNPYRLDDDYPTTGLLLSPTHMEKIESLLLFSEAFLNYVVSDAKSTVESETFLKWITWEHWDRTQKVVGLVIHRIDEILEGLEIPFGYLKGILLLEDSIATFRKRYIIDQIFLLLDKSGEFPFEMRQCLLFLSESCSDPFCRSYIFSKYKSWLKYIVYTHKNLGKFPVDIPETRNAVESVLMSCVPSAQSYRVSTSTSLFGVDTITPEMLNVDQQVQIQAVNFSKDEQVTSLLPKCFKYLLSILKNQTKLFHERNLRSDYSHTLYVSILRLLTWCITIYPQLANDFKLEIQSIFWDLFKIINNAEHNEDANRTELLRFLDQLTNNPEILDMFAKDNSAQELITLFIDCTPVHNNYNNQTLSFYYAVLAKFCKQNPALTVHCASHKNMAWSVKYIWLKHEFIDVDCAGNLSEAFRISIQQDAQHALQTWSTIKGLTKTQCPTHFLVRVLRIMADLIAEKFSNPSFIEVFENFNTRLITVYNTMPNSLKGKYFEYVSSVFCCCIKWIEQGAIIKREFRKKRNEYTRILKLHSEEQEKKLKEKQELDKRQEKNQQEKIQVKIKEKQSDVVEVKKDQQNESEISGKIQEKIMEIDLSSPAPSPAPTTEKAPDSEMAIPNDPLSEQNHVDQHQEKSVQSLQILVDQPQPPLLSPAEKAMVDYIDVVIPSLLKILKEVVYRALFDVHVEGRNSVFRMIEEICKVTPKKVTLQFIEQILFWYNSRNPKHHVKNLEGENASDKNERGRILLNVCLNYLRKQKKESKLKPAVDLAFYLHCDFPTIYDEYFTKFLEIFRDQNLQHCIPSISNSQLLVLWRFALENQLINKVPAIFQVMSQSPEKEKAIQLLVPHISDGIAQVKNYVSSTLVVEPYINRLITYLSYLTDLLKCISTCKLVHENHSIITSIYQSLKETLSPEFPGEWKNLPVYIQGVEIFGKITQEISTRGTSGQ